MRMPFPASKIWAAIEDWLIPSLRLNTHERALYYHLVRRTRLDGRRTVRVSRSKLARASGLSPGIARHYLRTLAQKQCIRILDRRPQGCLVEVRLPSQIRRALARLPQAAAAHLLWAPGQLERTAAGHPRAWPRPHPLVARNFRASILHRDALLDHAPRQPSKPRARLSYRRHPAGSSSAARKLGCRASSTLRDQLRRPASDLARKDKVATRPSNPSTFRPFNLQPSTRPLNPSTFRPFDSHLKPRCFYCRAPLRPRQWALDHIVPRTHDGSDSPSNLVAACHSCNSQKASSPADLFLRSLHQRRIISRTHLHSRLKAIRSLSS